MPMTHATVRPRPQARHLFVEGGIFSRERAHNRVIASVVAGVLVAAGLVFASTAQAAPFTPAVALSSSGVAPLGILAGEHETLRLSVANESTNEHWFNLAVTATVPAGITFVDAPGLGAPTVYQGPVSLPNGLGSVPAGQSLWVWQDVSDLPATGARDFEITVAVAQPAPGIGESADLAVFPVGSTLEISANAYASTSARLLPIFPGSTGKGGQAGVNATVIGNAPQTTTGVNAIRVTKSEPSAEGELLRGIHDNTTPYTLTVKNTSEGVTTGISVVDFIPAGLEFLGCGLTDNTANGAVEYDGTARLDATPDVAPCIEAVQVETVENPAGLTAGVYTKVIWGPFDLAADAALDIVYRAGIPMQMNTMNWGGTSVAGLGIVGQGANLDNNNGATTRHSVDNPLATDGDVYTNRVTAAGSYTGVVRTGTTRSAEGTDTQSVDSMDLRVLKTVESGSATAGEFITGQVAKYTLNLKTSEYADSSDIRLTDVIPNGLCPILPAGVTVTSGAIPIPHVDGTTTTMTGVDEADLPAECRPGSTSGTGVWKDLHISGGTVEWVAYDSASGEFILNFSVDPMAGSGTSIDVVYPVLMRGFYSGNEGTTSSLDSFRNTVSMTATTTGVHGSETGVVANVADDSSATLVAAGPSIGKTVLPRDLVAADGSCPTDPALYVTEATGDNLSFVLGDRVCYQLTVDFAKNAETRNPVISDMFPAGISYGGNTPKLFTGPTEVPGVSWNDSVVDTVLTWEPSTTVSGDGDRLVPRGSRLVIQVWGTVSSLSASPANLDKPQNLMKYRQQNVEGDLFFERDMAETVVEAGLQLSKGVASVNGASTFSQATSLPANCSGATPDCDHIQVVERDTVEYRIDLSGAAQNVTDLRVEDKLPAGITTNEVSLISNGGTVVTRGGTSYIVWTGLSVAAAPAVTVPLTYVVTIPDGTTAGTTLTNTASIKSYVFEANHSDQSSPSATVEPGVNGVTLDGTVDDSDVFLPDVALAKRIVSTDVDSINNNATGSDATPPTLPTPQAVHGEYITYQYSVTIPAHTSVKNAVMKDAGLLGLGTLSDKYTIDPSRTTMIEPTTVPAGFALTSDGGLQFPALFDNTGNTPMTFTVQISAYTDGPGTGATKWKNTDILTNTASFTATGIDKKATAQVEYVVPHPTITKTVNDNGRAVKAGQQLTYTLTATNETGRPTSFDTVLSDCVPEGLQVLSIVTPGGSLPALGARGSCADGRLLTWAPGDIAAGASRTLTYTVVVSPDAAGGARYLNKVLLKGYALDGVPESDPRQLVLTDDDTKTVTVEKATIVKTATPQGERTVGDTVDYTVAVTLPANVNFYTPTITDVVPAGLRVNTASIAVDPGTTGVTFSCTNGATGSVGGSISCLGSRDIRSDALARTVTLSYSATIVQTTTGSAPGLEGPRKNTATFAWANVAGAGAGSSVTDTETIAVAEPNLTIKKSVNGTDAQNSASAVLVEPGATASYGIVVRNPGGTNVSTAHDVVITDVVPAGLVAVTIPSVLPAGVTANKTVTGGVTTVIWTIEAIAPGASATLPYTATLAPSEDLNVTDVIRNLAGITEYWSVPSHATNPDAREYVGGTDPANVKPAFPNVVVTKAVATPGVSGATAKVGSAFPWLITITNQGKGTAQTVTAADVLPSGWGTPTVTAVTRNNVAIPAAQWGFAADSLTWTFANVAPGEIIVVTHTAIPTAAAYLAPGAGVGPSATGPSNPHLNTVALTATDTSGANENLGGDYVGDPATAEAFLRATDLTIVKSLVNDPAVKIRTGDAVSFVLTATNNGPQPASGVSITDTLPAGLTFAGVATPGVSVSGTWNPCTVVGETITCTLSGTLAASGAAASASVQVAAIALPPTVNDQLSQDLTNTASVTTTTPETNTGNNTDPETVTVWAKPSIEIVKSADVAPGKAAVAPGDNDTQYVLDGQTPPRIAHFSITVTNTGPLALRNVEVTDALAASCVNTVIPDLAPAGTPGASFTYVCEGPAPSASGYTNTANVTGETSNGDTATDTDISRVELTALDVEKAGVVSATVPVVGTLVNYTFTVTNRGGATITGVSLADVLPGLSVIVLGAWPNPAAPGTLSGGQSVTATATYPLTQVDIDGAAVQNTVTVAGTDPAGQLPTDVDTITVVPGNSPAITLAKTGALAAGTTGQAGDIVSYTFLATNTGNVTLHDATIVDPLPGLGALTFDWTNASARGILAPGDTVSATAEYTLTQSDVDAGIVTNTATASGTPPGATTPIEDDDTVDLVITPQPLIALQKTGALAAAATGKAGDTVEYSFTATNTGSVTLTDVAIADPLAGLSAIRYGSWPGATGVLAPTQSITATATYVLTQADVDAGRVVNVATTTGTPPTGPAVDGGDTATMPVQARPAIDLVKSGVLASGDTGLLGETIEYTFTATNSGNVTLTDVGIDDVSLPGLTALSFGAWPGAVGTLAPGQSVTATASYVLLQTDIELGYVDNRATTRGTPPNDATGNPRPPVTADDDERVITLQTPAITLVKDATFAAGQLGAVGDAVNYTFTATNTGNVTLVAVTIADPMKDLSSLTYVWPAVAGVLLPGESVTATALYRVTQTDVDAGKIVNTAHVIGTPPSRTTVAGVDDAVVNPPQAPAIGLVKDAALANGATGIAGDTVNYTFTVTNTGNVTLHGVGITDPMTGLTAVTFGTWPAAAGVLLPGASVTASASYLLTQADVDAGVVNNVATATGNPKVGPPVSDDDPASIAALQTPSITLSKTGEFAGGVGGVVGGTAEYSFTVKNTGTVTLSGVTVSDELPGLTGVAYGAWPVTAGVLAPGESVTATASLVLTQAHIDAGSLLNTATVTGTPPTGGPVTDADEVTLTVTPTPTIQLKKSGSLLASATGKAGDGVQFVMVATNVGNQTLHGVTVTDPMPGLSALSYGAWPGVAGVLAPGQSVTVTATYSLTAADVLAKKVTNIATVVGNSPGDSGSVTTVKDESTATVTVLTGLGSTGADPGPALTLAALILGLGGLLLAAARRRRKHGRSV